MLIHGFLRTNHVLDFPSEVTTVARVLQMVECEPFILSDCTAAERFALADHRIIWVVPSKVGVCNRRPIRCASLEAARDWKPIDLRKRVFVIDGVIDYRWGGVYGVPPTGVNFDTLTWFAERYIDPLFVDLTTEERDAFWVAGINVRMSVDVLGQRRDYPGIATAAQAIETCRETGGQV